MIKKDTFVDLQDMKGNTGLSLFLESIVLCPRAVYENSFKKGIHIVFDCPEAGIYNTSSY